MQARHLPPQKKKQNYHFEGFGRRQTRSFSFRKIDIFRATKSAGRLWIKPARFCFREIGGTKKHGPAPSTTCSSRTARSCAHTSRRTRGSWMEFTTKERDG